MTGLSYKYSIVRHFFFFCLSIKLIKSVERQGIENQTLEKLDFFASSARENKFSSREYGRAIKWKGACGDQVRANWFQFVGEERRLSEHWKKNMGTTGIFSRWARESKLSSISWALSLSFLLNGTVTHTRTCHVAPVRTARRPAVIHRLPHSQDGWRARASTM